MVEPRNTDLACQTEANAEDGPNGATVLSPDLGSPHGTLTCTHFRTLILNT